MTIETDRCRLLSGVRQGVTLGSPITIMVENRDHANWLASMSPQPLPAGQERPPALTIPRPGHADLTGVAKHGHDDIRNVLERASARETVGRVAGGAVCKKLLAEIRVTIRGRVTAIGEVAEAGRGHRVLHLFELLGDLADILLTIFDKGEHRHQGDTGQNAIPAQAP